MSRTWAGNNPLVKDVMVQIDAMYGPDPTTRMDTWNILEPALERVRDRYAAETSSIGAPKEPIHLFFDYGQLRAGGRGGRRAPDVAYFCVAELAVPECVNPPVPWAACGPNDTCGAGLTCVSTCQSTKLCVSDECAAPCRIDQSCHQYGGLPYSMQTIVRGDPAERYAYMPRNRRGTFAELLFLSSWIGEMEKPDKINGVVDHSTCNLFGSGPDYPGCKFVFPGHMGLLLGLVTPPSPIEPLVEKIKTATHVIFHELGHVVGLLDGAIQPTAQSCSTDVDCTVTNLLQTRCRGGVCIDGWNYAPNHQSSMNYYTSKKKVIDAAGNIDYSSGLRPSLRGFEPLSTGSCPLWCPPLNSPECPLNGVIPPEIEHPGGLCCLDFTCVGPSLWEEVGIGDFFGEGGSFYRSNRDWQLARLGCIHNPQGETTGPRAVDAELNTPYIDWNWNGQLDTQPVGEFLIEWGTDCFDTLTKKTLKMLNTHTFTDTDEWGFIAEHGFWDKGINKQPGMWQYGTPVCGEDEEIWCPTGYECDHGECMPTSGAMAFSQGSAASRGEERQGFACPLE